MQMLCICSTNSCTNNPQEIEVMDFGSNINCAVLLLLLDDVASGIQAERISDGYKLICTVLFRGVHTPEILWSSANDAINRAAINSFSREAIHHTILSSEITIPDHSASPPSCQVTVPLYRCAEMNSVYSLKFPIHWNHSADGEYTRFCLRSLIITRGKVLS